MAFTKINLTGTIDTIRGMSNAVNDLIDDLLSTDNAKGASQIGIEDSAGNMSADNVEDALAEIFTDTEVQRDEFNSLDENPTTTTGTTWGYQAGSVRFDNTVTDIAASTVALTDDKTNYVQVNLSGTVSRNITGFTAGQIPIRQIVVASGVQTTSTDKRAWFQSGPQDLSSTANPTFVRPVVTGLNDGTNNVDIPTNGMAAAKFMLGDSSTIVWFYLNTAPPGWKVTTTGADTVLGVSDKDVGDGGGDYDVEGGNPDTAASWDIDGLSADSHTHTVDIWTSNKTGSILSEGSTTRTRFLDDSSVAESVSSLSTTDTAVGKRETTAVGSTQGISSDSTYRPSASVGRLFQLDTAP